MKLKRWFLLSGLSFCFIVGLLAFRPVPVPGEQDCLTLDGVVTGIFESGTNDISIRLSGSDKTFYVNRGIEKGLDFSKLRADLINQLITIKYPKYWTPLDPSSSIRHISKIEFNGRTVFTELND